MPSCATLKPQKAQMTKIGSGNFLADQSPASFKSKSRYLIVTWRLTEKLSGLTIPN